MNSFLNVFLAAMAVCGARAGVPQVALAPVAAPLVAAAQVGYAHAVPDNVPPFASQVSVVNRALAGYAAAPYFAAPYAAAPYAAAPYVAASPYSSPLVAASPYSAPVLAASPYVAASPYAAPFVSGVGPVPAFVK